MKSTVKKIVLKHINIDLLLPSMIFTSMGYGTIRTHDVLSRQHFKQLCIKGYIIGGVLLASKHKKIDKYLIVDKVNWNIYGCARRETRLSMQKFVRK